METAQRRKVPSWAGTVLIATHRDCTAQFTVRSYGVTLVKLSSSFVCSAGDDEMHGAVHAR